MSCMPTQIILLNINMRKNCTLQVSEFCMVVIQLKPYRILVRYWTCVYSDQTRPLYLQPKMQKKSL